MEKLILNIMKNENISESELQSKKETLFKTGETLSCEYLKAYLKRPVYTLYGENDSIISHRKATGISF